MYSSFTTAVGDDKSQVKVIPSLKDVHGQKLVECYFRRRNEFQLHLHDKPKQ